MAVSKARLEQAVEVLRSFGATRVLLFGSYLRDPENARDLDLAAEGVPLKSIWRADGAVTEALGVPSDVVFREESPEFYDLIRKRATVLYEQTHAD